MSRADRLQPARDAAGRHYAAVLAQFRSALVELAAIDRALANGEQPHAFPKTFHNLPRNFAPTGFVHPIYAPNVGGDLYDDINARADCIIEEVGENG